MTDPPRTPDGRYIVVDGVLWRATRPDLSETERECLVHDLMDARRAVGAGKRAGDDAAVAKARKAVDASPDDTNMIVARLTYAFSKRTAVYGAVGRMDNKGQAAIALDVGGSAAPGRTQNGIMAGLRHSF